MHRYEPGWPADYLNWESPSPADFTYRDALDIAHYASLEPLTTWRTWPEVWHLDHNGRWRCFSKGSTFHSVCRYAESPEELLLCRQTRTGARCPDFWVMLEPRHDWISMGYEVTEADGQAFTGLRSSLAGFGIVLLDVVIFHPDFRWWSLNELTCGTTAWSFQRPGTRELSDG